ncbi:MAG: methyltransferase [Thermofilum sp.]|jgi:release factor glutamine methyltransferase|nr:methyltransferase [Thermofilum sp.]
MGCIVFPPDTTPGRLIIAITKILLRFYLVHHRFWINFRGVRLYVPQGCFTPVGTISTDLMASILLRFQLQEPVVEIGCGAGQLSLLVARRGVYVVGVDIDEKCARATRINSRLNDLDSLVDVVLCDSGSCLRSGSFNLVFANPPYFPFEAERPEDTSIAAGLDLRVLRKILSNSIRVAKKSVPVIFTSSSLTGVRIGRVLSCVSMPLEKICVYLAR